MTLKRTPRPRDPVQLGKLMVGIMTGQESDIIDDGKDAAAAAWGGKALPPALPEWHQSDERK